MASFGGAYLSPELLEGIAAHCEVPALLMFERLSRGCRAATAEAWRRETRTRFPRVDAILRLSSAQDPPGYRELYRRQLLAEGALQPRRLSLADFVFTVELDIDGVMQHEWSGVYSGACGLFGWPLNPYHPTRRRIAAEARMWVGDAPAWFSPFLAICRDGSTEDEPWVPPALGRSYTCTVCVTHELHTVRLYRGHPESLLRDHPWINFSKRHTPPLFRGEVAEFENEEEGPPMIDLADGHQVTLQVTLCEYETDDQSSEKEVGTSPESKREGVMRLSFDNDLPRVVTSDDLNATQALLEYFRCLTTRAV